MSNKGTSDRTAAKKSSKSSSLLRQPCILAMLLLCAVFVQAQRKLPIKDTVMVVLLVSDTSNDITHTFPFAMKAYSVRDRHNQNEKSNGDWSCWNCEDYMEHSFYLDDKKKPLNSTVIVWQSVSAK